MTTRAITKRKVTPKISAPADPLAEQKQKILAMPLDDPALLAHTRKRILSMDDRALINRADKIGHQKKMLYFVRCMMEEHTGRNYAPVLNACFRIMQERVWWL